jgi:hypothetical protein
MNVKIIALSVAVFVSSTTLFSQQRQNYQWKNVAIGGGGFVDGIVCHPNEKGLRYARTDMGGAYRWHDGLTQWQPLLDWLPYADYNLMGIESIALDPNNPDKLYLACGTYTNSKAPNGAILVSDNRGVTFKRVDVPFKMGGNETGRGNGERMAVDPVNGNMVYLGTRHNGLWRSIDAGATWLPVQSFPNVVDSSELDNPYRFWQGGAGIVSIGFIPKTGKGVANVSDIYVAVSLQQRDNFFVSKDGGHSWHAVEGHPKQYRPTQMAIASNGVIYLSYGDTPGPTPMTTGAVWKYNSQSGSWSHITPDVPGDKHEQGFGYAAVTVDVHNPDLVLASTFYRPQALGGDEIFKSSDGGSTWKAVMASGVAFDYSKAPYVKHTPIHWLFDVEIDPFDPNHVMFTTGYGGHETYNFKQIDNPDVDVSWQILANGIEETVALELLSTPYKKGPQLYSAIGDYCGFAHFDVDESPWKGCFENPHFSNTTGIAAAGINHWVMARVGSVSHHSEGENIGFSIDGGRLWEPAKALPTPTSKFGHIAVSALGSHIIWTPHNEKPFITNNRGGAWQIIDELPVNTRVVADKTDDQLFYAMSLFNGELYISRDGGERFQTTALNLPHGIPMPGFRGDERGGQDRLYTVYKHPNHLWLALYDGLYFSTNSGSSFSRLSGVEQLHAFGFGKSAPKSKYPTLFVVGVVNGKWGIFRSDNVGQTWVLISDDAHQYGMILHITGDPKRYGRVYVGTHGRGIVYGDIAK